MPNVTALPRTLENGRTLTQFTDTTSTTAVTYTYPTQQTGIQIENSGEKDIFVTVGSYTNQLVKADTKWKVDVSFTSFSISSVVNSQEFIATAFIEATATGGTVKQVNGVIPDANGNVTIPVPQVDTSTLATKTEVQAVASGSPKGTYATLSALQAAFPTGNSNIYLVTGNVKEVASLTVTAIPTTSGNVTVTLNGVATNIAVDPATDTTTTLVATKIRNATYSTGAVTGGTGSTVTFTAAAVGVKTDATYSAGSTGATGTMTTTTQGVDADGNWYYWNGSAWTIGGKYIETGVNLELKPTTVNLFDKTKLRTGYEVYSTGAIQSQGVDSAVTDYNLVSGATSIYISGLTAYTSGLARNCFFYDANKVAMGSLTQIAINLTEKQINVPANAVYFVMSPWQRKSSAEVMNLDTIQIEIGTVKTAYQAYKAAISKIENYDIIKTVPPKTAGKSILIFGDSRAETATVSDDGVTYTEGTRSNWPTFSKQYLQLGQMWNYAKSGGHYVDGYQTGQIRQQLSTQITTAISNNRSGDIIVVDASTNDDTGSLVLGDYNTIMAKTTLNSLDRMVFGEAVRWAFWQIRTAYPNAICFCATPTQRPDKELNQAMIDLMVKIAKRYNFIIIDVQNESGIVRDFEVNGGAGRYLSDGLHPNTAGQQLEANLFNRNILNALNDVF